MDNRLKKRSDFDKVFKKGKRVYTKTFLFVYVPAKELKIGYSVSKKNGGAVVRNRIKRLLRAVMREFIPDIAGNYHIVVVPRVSEEYSFACFLQDMKYALAKEKLIACKNSESADKA